MSAAPASSVPTFGEVAPVVAAVVAGVFLLLNGRAIAAWTAGQTRKADVSAASIAADESDRARVSQNMWGIVKDLRGEVSDLRAALERREQQVDSLIEDMAQLRAIERQLRDENTRLRERVATLEGQMGGVALVPPPQAAQP